MAAFEYRHVVGFAETSLVGTVYYVNHLAWQGRCRELFLKEHAPEVLEQIGRDMRFVTIRCSCDYSAELHALDEIAVRMRIIEQAQNRLTLGFEYWRCGPGGEDLVARGLQELAAMRIDNGELTPTDIPEALIVAMRPFADG